ncbi:hypothetical protein MLD38_014008 [Melastoma candidum]|uniref:Uncharacterized protein n=1 Tax=Melastoma candidum TaxID=119954 RepID=A0ACB9RJU1_9MYRT|nr:hypothetical protein MLD38_014008 [Melastoma candidum]
MPRKVSYGLDYDEDYGYDYEEVDDYRLDYDADDSGDVPIAREEPSRSTSNVWRCSICTYDNEEGLPACDICGVIRKTHIDVNNAKKTASASLKKDLPTERISTTSEENSNVVTSRGRHVNVIKSEHGSQLDIHASGSREVALEHGTSADEYKHQVLTSSSNSFSDESTNSAQKASSLKPYSHETWMLPEKGESVLTQLNIAIVGHVDSGKSTLSGRLLHLSGRISQKEMHKYEKEAKLQGKGSFAFAWALDESAEERERGITMTVAVAYFDTKKYHVVLLDSPGHKDFVPNMISGAIQADAAVLVIDASVGSFEAGMDGNKGQTREHAQLIRSFGIEQLIVAVNKMDAIEYSKERYELIKRQLGTFLRTSGFKDTSVQWVPMSAITNQNLDANPDDIRFSSWYKGPYLLKAIDSLPPPLRDFSRPLVMPVSDVIRSPSTGQISACGKLESGAMRAGLKVLVMPSGHLGTVKSMEHDSRPCTVARAGDHVAVVLQGVDGSRIIKGGVLCHPDFPISVAKHFELKVLTLEGASPILIGSQVELHIHHAMEAACVKKIISVLDPKTGEEMKKSPRILTPRQRAVIEVVLQGPVCAGEYSNCKALGRVSLRASGRTAAVGFVTRVIED